MANEADPTPRVEVSSWSRTERWVQQTWMTILQIQISSKSQDFMALGGESVAAIRFMARAYEDCGVRVPLRALLVDGATIESMAEYLDSAGAQQ